MEDGAWDLPALDTETLRLARGADRGAVTAGAGGDAVTPGVLEAALRDDGAHLEPLALARIRGLAHAGADGRHGEEPSPFGDGDLVGTVSAVCVVDQVRPDCGPAGSSCIAKAAVSGPVAVGREGLAGDDQSDKVHHGGPDKALYVMDAREQAHWATLLPGLAPGRLGENLLIEPGPLGGVDDVEIGAILHVGHPDEGVRLRVTGVRNPCPTFARGVGRSDWVEVFSARARVGVYLRVLKAGTVQAGDQVHVVSVPGHRVTCTRWFAHHDPRDAQAVLTLEAFGRCVIADFTRAYLQAAAREKVG